MFNSLNIYLYMKNKPKNCINTASCHTYVNTINNCNYVYTKAYIVVP